MRLTQKGKGMVAAIMLSVATMVAIPPQPAKAFVGGDAAIIVAFLGGAFMTAVQTFFTQLIMNKLLGIGSTANVEQMAANTLGIQQALQHHSAATVEAVTRQALETIIDRDRRMFGVFGHVTIGGRSVNVGSNAVSSCRRIKDAHALTVGSVRMDQIRHDVTEEMKTYNSKYASATGVAAGMRKDRTQYGDDVFDLSWLTAGSLPAGGDAFEQAKRSIQYLTNPDPLPPPADTNNAASKEYDDKLAQQREAVRLPQEVLARQLALRTPITSDSKKRSYLQIMTDWGRQAAEDASKPAAIQVKTDSGVLREQVLLLNSLVAIGAQSIQAQQDTNALLAVLAAQTTRAQGEMLRREYNTTVSAE